MLKGKNDWVKVYAWLLSLDNEFYFSNIWWGPNLNHALLLDMHFGSLLKLDSLFLFVFLCFYFLLYIFIYQIIMQSSTTTCAFSIQHWTISISKHPTRAAYEFETQFCLGAFSPCMGFDVEHQMGGSMIDSTLSHYSLSVLVFQFTKIVDRIANFQN